MSPGLTRRHFLTTAAAGLASLPCGDGAYSQVTGVANPKLTAYDDLMTSFLREHKPPGAALAVAHRGRLVYARGFGHADVEKKETVQPTSLFRIASVSKPITAAAVMHLVDKQKLKLDDPVFPLLKLEPHLEPGGRVDPRLHTIRVHHCLQHTAGWDRDKSFDPMSAGTAERVARALNVRLPVNPKQIICYTMGKPLDFAPGTAYAYSNFGYCVLGRVIEAVSGRPYHEFVAREILAPLGIRRMRLGKNLLQDRAAEEVRYYDSKQRTGRAISGPQIGKPAPLPYGVECLETMDANGGWIASAVDLVRFAVALDDLKKCPILGEASLRAMLAPPAGEVGHEANGRPKGHYYACGWDVRPADAKAARFTKWHLGMLAGTSTLLVCRQDGIDWACLFNSDATKDGKFFADLIDPLLHKPADEIKNWPQDDLFDKF
jgi:CubicO group peptidase (beta-lactamase class C family)